MTAEIREDASVASCGGRGCRRALARVSLVLAGCAVAALVAGSARAVDPTFTPAPGSPFPVGTEPHSIAAADFDRDGRPDLVVANSGSDNISVLLGTGNGSFAAALTIAVGDSPHGLTAADVNRDGKPDVVVANSGSDTISVLLGNGAGGFALASGSPIPVANSPWYVVAADLNNDGNPDLAITHTGFEGGVAATQLTILLGNGAGGFAPAPGSPITVGRIPYGVAVADFNRDGKPDLAVANQFSSSVSILLGNGDGTFAAAPGSPITVGSGPSWVAAGDFNEDGRPDLAVTNQGSGNVSILLGNGAGGFTAAPPVAAGTGPTPVVARDLNGDGHLDLAVGNIGTFRDAGADTVSILLGNGDGTFRAAASSPLTVGDKPFSLTVADFDGDGRPDLAVANYGSNNVSVLLNTTPDLTPPTCVVVRLSANQIVVRAQDVHTGVRSIVPIAPTANVVVNVPAFEAGTNASVFVTATRQNRNLAATLRLRVTDLAGNAAECDPVLATLRLRGNGPAVRTFSNIPRAEHRLTIKPLGPGLTTAVVSANGHRFRLDLRRKRVVARDIGSALNHGRGNRVRIAVYGRRGAAALVALTD